MGILNVTPDSFSDGGQFISTEKAVAHAQKMLAQGVDIIDVGGESTRPGAAPVPAEEEKHRVCPVIEALNYNFPDITISIDTFKANVASAALEAGAEIINDITGLTGDPDMLTTAAASNAGIVIMHMKGKPRTMQDRPEYQDVVQEVTQFLQGQKDLAIAAGIEPERLAFDPGIGFGKSLEHNLQILAQLDSVGVHDRPVLLGVSRKSFMGRILETDDLAAREWPTVGLTSYAIEHGARILRVHDIQSNAQAARMSEAILN
jgi:dihydropteroate synthase